MYEFCANDAAVPTWRSSAECMHARHAHAMLHFIDSVIGPAGVRAGAGGPGGRPGPGGGPVASPRVRGGAHGDDKDMRRNVQALQRVHESLLALHGRAFVQRKEGAPDTWASVERMP